MHFRSVKKYFLNASIDKMVGKTTRQDCSAVHACVHRVALVIHLTPVERLSVSQQLWSALV